MNQRPSKKARREAAKRAALRKQFRLWGGLAAIAALAIGSFVLISGGSGDEAAALAPDFELETLAGEPVSLSDYRGRPVAVTFMHSF
ncbi:peroxiredoxin family protein [Ilumatobacter sp.]|uniref:peroxiredoxin family protein n=1 Tax=Ilumatobacter sp. TaxID=1967498 RepID=UPI003750AA53